MKNKVLACTLSFMLLFSSFNINRSHAVMIKYVPVPMAVTIATIAVASGVSMSGVDDIYDIARSFSEYKKDSIGLVRDVFDSSVSVINGFVTVGKDFLHIVKDYLDATFKTLDKDYNYSTVDGIPYLLNYTVSSGTPSYAKDVFDAGIKIGKPTANDFTVGQLYFDYVKSNSLEHLYNVYRDGYRVNSSTINLKFDAEYSFSFVKNTSGKILLARNYLINDVYNIALYNVSDYVVDSFDIPYKGGYSWEDNIDSNLNDNGDLVLGVPSDGSDLVGLGSSDVLKPNYDLPINGVVTLPSVENPSIELDHDVTLPFNPSLDGPSDVPGDTPGIIESIVGLVVPSSTYWQNTFDDFFNNFGDAFPMIDIGRFKDLCINGVPPKDIEVTIMGAKGTIFNTKYLNSIVDWLQPIVSAFMAFLLMLYNYRKVYKLIRGFEPFSGIADGNPVADVRGKTDGSMTWSDGSSITRESIQSRYYGRDL